MSQNKTEKPPAIPEHEIKQNSGVSASMALQAMQKAWELRQAANAAGDPNAREEILAKAINKEIEAESFGKAAKYTQSGAFQGLAAGAGLGVQPGVTLGKITGALVGGLVATVTGLLGGGIGSVYGAMHGPFWNLGEMASHGVRGVIGDFPNWQSTPSQKKALEKMVMQSRETQAPTKEELEQMKTDMPDEMPQSWSQTANDMTSWRPSMPSMPSLPKGAALGLGGLGASMPSWGGQGKTQAPQQQGEVPGQSYANQTQSQQAPQPQNAQPQQQQNTQPSNQSNQPSDNQPEEAPPKKRSIRHSKPNDSPNPPSSKPSKPAPKSTSASTAKPNPKPAATRKTENTKPKPTDTKPTSQSKPSPSQNQPSKDQTTRPSPPSRTNSKPASTSVPETNGERRKPRKLNTAPSGEGKGRGTKEGEKGPVKRAPRKLERKGTGTGTGTGSASA